MNGRSDSQRRQTAVPVLCYHSISDQRRDGTLRWSVSPSAFDEHMALLAARRHTPLTVSQYAAVLRHEAPLPPQPVLVTFDDGFADLATAALVSLRRHGITATAYVITATVGAVGSGDTGRTLDWDELAALRDGGVEIGSHSHTHRALDLLSQAEVRREAELSKAVLEDRLRQRVSSFAYPYGYHGRAVRSHVIAAGYTSACGVKNALSHPADDAFAIARVLIERDLSVTALDALLDGRGWPLAWPGERLRTRSWRAYRRTRRLVRSSGAEGAREIAS